MMVISDKIEEAILEFRTMHGRTPTRLILGKLQLAALNSFAEKYSMGRGPVGSPSFESSEGVKFPIVVSPNENELTLV